MARNSTPTDVHKEITDKIVTAIETAGTFQMPWIKSSGASLTRPVNIASKNPYNGVNVISLWVSALAADYASNVWGTYRQWQAAGCQVRKGERSSLVVFYKIHAFERRDDATGETEQAERMIARASRVFNADQVDGVAHTEEPDLPETPGFTPLARAEAFVAATGARIEETGDRACFIPSRDTIRMPERRRFTGTDTSSPAESFHAVLFHELVHWSGVTSRLDRDMTSRFGDAAYAMEELVAEIGAAFIAADLGIAPEPREDHARYLKSWLAVLKNDKKAIFTAAAKASQAATWLADHERS